MTAAAIVVLLTILLATLYRLAQVTDQRDAARKERDAARAGLADAEESAAHWFDAAQSQAKRARDSRRALIRLMARKERQREEHGRTLAKVLELGEGRRTV